MAKIVRPIRFDEARKAARRARARDSAAKRRAKALDNVKARVVRMFRYPDISGDIFWENHANDNREPRRRPR